MKKFEEFLMEKHAEQYIGTKNCMDDDFEDWLSKLDIDNWIIYGQWFGNEMFKEGQNPEVLK